DHPADAVGAMVGAAHVPRHDLHRDVALAQVLLAELSHVAVALHGVPLVRDGDLAEPPPLGMTAELGLGAAMAAAVEHDLGSVGHARAPPVARLRAQSARFSTTSGGRRKRRPPRL